MLRTKGFNAFERVTQSEVGQLATVLIENIDIVASSFDIDYRMLRSNQSNHSFLIDKFNPIRVLLLGRLALEIFDELTEFVNYLLKGPSGKKTIEKQIRKHHKGNPYKQHLGKEFEERGREHQAEKEVGKKADCQPLTHLPQHILYLRHSPMTIDEHQNHARDGRNRQHDGANDRDTKIRMLHP